MGKALTLGFACSMTVAASAGAASPWELDLGDAWYLRPQSSLLMPRDQDVSWLAGGAIIDGTVAFKNGYTAGAAMGHRLNRFLTLETEVAYGSFEYDSFEGRVTSKGDTTVLALPIDGEVEILAGTISTLWTLGRAGGLTPYVGFGGGIIDLRAKVRSVAGEAVNQQSNDTSELAQALAGFDFRLGPSSALGARYRFLWAPSATEAADDFTAHSVGIDLTWEF